MRLISTIDFFYPLVEDPYIQGRIAACNVLSDLYAMGVTEIDTILMVLAISLKMSELEREVITSQMIEGFNSIAEEAKTNVTGGQSIMNPWPIIGGVAISSVKPENYIKPNYAKKGDMIILTKPLGTQIAVNAYSYYSNQNEKWGIIKKIVDQATVINAYDSASKFMSRKNLNAALLMKKYGAHAATDITGFGILGHAKYLAKAQKEEVGFRIDRVPVLTGMRNLDKTEARNFRFQEGYSAETSGGLFICMGKKSAEEFVQEMLTIGENAFIVGEVIQGHREAFFKENYEMIEVL